jgi:hypothetical protein
MTVRIRRCRFVIRMSFLENDKDVFFVLCAFMSDLVRRVSLLNVGGIIGENWLWRTFRDPVWSAGCGLPMASLITCGARS